MHSSELEQQQDDLSHFCWTASGAAGVKRRSAAERLEALRRERNAVGEHQTSEPGHASTITPKIQRHVPVPGSGRSRASEAPPSSTKRVRRVQSRFMQDVTATPNRSKGSQSVLPFLSLFLELYFSFIFCAAVFAVRVCRLC